MAKKAHCLTTAHDIKRLGTILAVWAHPDDESFLAAGLLAIAVRNGQKVICITATKGEVGQTADETKWPTSQLGAIRARELATALRILGVTAHHWLGYQDGHCAEVSLEEGTRHVKRFISRYQPDTIITFAPHGSTGHPDHKTVSRWVAAAVRGQSTPIVYYVADTKEQYDRYFKHIDKQFNIYFMIDKPPLVPANRCDILLELAPATCQLKCQALEAQPSQTAPIVQQFGRDFVQKAVRVEGFIKAKQG